MSADAPPGPVADETPGVMSEVRALAGLAMPVVLTRLGQIAMGVVDSIMAGRVSDDAVAGVGLGGAAFWMIFIFGVGVVFALEPMVSQAVGANDAARARRSFVAGRWVALGLAVPMMALISLMPMLLHGMGQPDALMRHAQPYLLVLIFAAPGWLLYMAHTAVLMAHGHTRPAMWITLAANVVNLGGNWVFVTGAFGMPALGAAGVALSTVLCVYFQLFAALWLMRRGGPFGDLRAPWTWPDFAAVRSMMRIGLPIGIQTTLEQAGFGAVALLMGLQGPEASSAHQVAINVASVSFMAALGLAGAASVRVGMAVGRRDLRAVHRAGYTALAMAVSLAALSGLVMIVLRHPLAALYLTDPARIELTAKFLLIAALFQLADMSQVVGFGILRGSGDTRVPAAFNIVGYWLVGLPLGWWLVFRQGFPPQALWWGLTIGLFLVATALVVRFGRWTRDDANVWSRLHVGEGGH